MRGWRGEWCSAVLWILGVYPDLIHWELNVLLSVGFVFLCFAFVFKGAQTVLRYLCYIIFYSPILGAT